METIFEKLNIKSLTNVVGTHQVRVGAVVQLSTGCKTILTTTQKVLVERIDRKETDVHVHGKVITRVIFIDEADGYNSEERADAFSEKITVGDAADVVPMAKIINSAKPRATRNDDDIIISVATEHTVNIALVGMVSKEINYVAKLGDGIETQNSGQSFATFGQGFFEHFESGETFSLDQNIGGILGTDVGAHVRDITVANGKFTVKGTACVSAQVVRIIDGAQVASTAAFEFDFSKTFNKKEISERDIVCGNVEITDIVTRIETRTTAELVVEVGLAFVGHSVVRQDVSAISDAFMVGHDVKISTTAVTDTVALGQVNLVADVEGNIAMPDAAPFIGRVLSWGVPTVGPINVKPTDDRVIVEGVLTTHIIYECEEKNTFAHTAEVPFSIATKIDGATKRHDINAAVTPLSCNVKARRGKELLVDARVGVNMTASTTTASRIVSGVEMGKIKQPGDHNVTIRMVGAGETLWDIAKSVSVPSAEIVRQNPAADNGIQPGDRLVIYRRA